MAKRRGGRSRHAVACTLCRERRLRCDRRMPCRNCLRARNGDCVYHNTSQDQTESSNPPGHRQIDSMSRTGISTAQNRLSSPVNIEDVLAAHSRWPDHQTEIMRMKRKIEQPEDQLARQAAGHNQASAIGHNLNSNIETISCSLSGVFRAHNENSGSSNTQGIARNIAYKTRLLGQSHWAVNIPLIRDLLEDGDADNPFKWDELNTCESLAKEINARRTPPWPSPLTPDVPQKEVADSLVAHYIDTTEAIYPVLHMPTFYRHYEALWVPGTRPNTSFLVLLKLVMAIGAIVYDFRFNLRMPAIRWVCEAQTWVAQPKFKSRLDLHSLQIGILLLIAQERLGIGEPMWISIGALVRKAIYMGLHRDPIQKHVAWTFTAAEMRRRLWNTILELSLLSSLTSGGPPLISLDDFDTAPPGNFDDNQLTADNPVPKPDYHYTRISIAIWLRRTFPIRLAVVKHLNGLALSQTTYRETLLLDSELRKAYREINETVKASSGPDKSFVPSAFEIQAVDFLIQRIILALHSPYFGPSLNEAAYAFSRQAVIDASLRIFRTANPHRADSVDGEVGIPHLCLYSAGFYPTATIQAALLIAVELRVQSNRDSLGPALIRSDLEPVLGEATSWAFHRILSGETNVKGYLLMQFLYAQIVGPLKGRNKELGAETHQATTEPDRQCVAVLQRRMMSKLDQKHGLELVSLGTPLESGDDEFIGSFDLFELGEPESMDGLSYNVILGFL